MKKRAGLLITVISVAYLLHLFFGFAEAVKGYGPVKKNADAIVVLTGGMGRADEGLRLLREGRAGVLILSGVHADADIDSIFLNKTSKAERGKIILEKVSSSTYENAVEVNRLVARHGFKSIILLTSAYHMKRAEFIFKKILPADVKILTHSVSTPNFDAKRWWGGGSLALLIIEFLKYYWFVVKFAPVG
jgi:uncharacterized SAM-binding protein YcdF (DUF218 family)